MEENSKKKFKRLTDSEKTDLYEDIVPLETLRNFPIEGEYGTKMDCIIKHIKYIISIEPADKILVFSQWVCICVFSAGVLTAI